ncbi:DUF2304 domain-containing protein [Peptococcus simiae]|uniref:DUF2304 domain-containing protein n=1 Tax=Peptococcus simiae TaxID=1643805 RepID=A0ABW9GZG2_9FIRM
MELRLQVIILLACLASLLVYGEAVRREKLMLRITFPWLFCLLVTVLLTLFPAFIDGLAFLLGVASPMNAVFFCAVLFLVMVGFFNYVTMSKLRQQTVRTVQELALLEYSLRQQNKRGDKE